jgi:acylphosphatase
MSGEPDQPGPPEPGRPEPGRPEPDSAGAARLTAWVRGRVQGVGFRWWAAGRARELGLTGYAANLDDGRVEIVAEGSRAAAEQLLADLRGGAPPGRVAGVAARWSPARGDRCGFGMR